MSIRVLTFNVFGTHCRDFIKFSDIIKPFAPDIICSQETNKPHKHQNTDSGYKLIDSAGHGGEIVGIFNNLSTGIQANKIEQIAKISTRGADIGVADRHAILFSYNGIRVANLHLEGGRYSDQTLFTQFDELLAYKLELLQKVISQKPDIIMGDFNSVYNSNPKKLADYLEGQYKYFQSHVLHQTQPLSQDQRRMVDKWNAAPYELLRQAGYKYGRPNNEALAITNGRGQSIIDTIWYNPRTVKPYGAHIIPDIIRTGDDYSSGKCISDHNPVFAEFRSIRKSSGKSLKSKSNARGKNMPRNGSIKKS